MLHKFAKTTNVQRFLVGMTNLQQRGAPEASWMLVEAPAGRGKTRTAEWWALQGQHIIIRAKEGYTPNWLYDDLCEELGINPHRNKKQRFGEIINQLAIPNAADQQRTIVIDECEHMLHQGTLEALRDITDTLESEVILVGMDGVMRRLKRLRQITSRIGPDVVKFEPATYDDVAICAKTLAEVTLQDDVIEQITKESDGLLRNAINAIARAERHAKRNNLDTISAAQLTGVPLVRKHIESGTGR